LPPAIHRTVEETLNALGGSQVHLHRLNRASQLCQTRWNIVDSVVLSGDDEVVVVFSELSRQLETYPAGGARDERKLCVSHIRWLPGGQAAKREIPSARTT
jgi:hypothetical protein